MRRRRGLSTPRLQRATSLFMSVTTADTEAATTTPTVIWTNPSRSSTVLTPGDFSLKRDRQFATTSASFAKNTRDSSATSLTREPPNIRKLQPAFAGVARNFSIRKTAGKYSARRLKSSVASKVWQIFAYNFPARTRDSTSLWMQGSASRNIFATTRAFLA